MRADPVLSALPWMLENDGSENLRSISNALARSPPVPPKIDPPVLLAKASFIDLRWQTVYVYIYIYIKKNKMIVFV